MSFSFSIFFSLFCYLRDIKFIFYQFLSLNYCFLNFQEHIFWMLFYILFFLSLVYDLQRLQTMKFFIIFSLFLVSVCSLFCCLPQTSVRLGHPCIFRRGRAECRWVAGLTQGGEWGCGRPASSVSTVWLRGSALSVSVRLLLLQSGMRGFSLTLPESLPPSLSSVCPFCLQVLLLILPHTQPALPGSARTLSPCCLLHPCVLRLYVSLVPWYLKCVFVSPTARALKAWDHFTYCWCDPMAPNKY